MGDLSSGSVIAGVTLSERIVEGEKISCWRGKRSDGTPVTVHVLHAGAKDREKKNFLGGARKIAAAAGGVPMAGIVDIVAVVPSDVAYVARGGCVGTMTDMGVFGWSVTENITFMRRLCRAVARLHDKDIFHGCLRPGNVLLDDDLKPIVSDAGMIVIDDSYEGSSAAKTDYAVYAPREVRIGHRADVRSDIYSLGRILHFVLLGDEPSLADDLALAEETYSPLHDIAGSEPGLVRIVRKATARLPEDRYESVDALLGDLERYESPTKVGVGHRDGREGDGNPTDSGERRVSFFPDEPTPDSGRRPSHAPPSGRPPTSERPPDSERPSRRPPAPTEPQGPAPARTAWYVADDDEDDVLTPAQMRAGGIIGALLIAGSLTLAYVSATPSLMALVGTILGCIGLSLWTPAIGGWPVATRFIAAVILGVGAWLFDPVGMVAAEGLRSKLNQGTPEQRGMRLDQLRQRGIRDFVELDLRGIDLSRIDLSGLRFDRSKLRGGKAIGARLTGVSLDEADITSVDFSGADLSDIEPATANGWRKSICDDDTLMPPGWFCNEGRPEAETQRAEVEAELEEEE